MINKFSTILALVLVLFFSASAAIAEDTAKTAPQKYALNHHTLELLRKRVMRELGLGYTCGEIRIPEPIHASDRTFMDYRQYFEVVSKKFPAARVNVAQEKFYTQKEYTKKSRVLWDMIKKIGKNPGPLDRPAIDALLEVGTMPQYWYRDIGVSIAGMQPDETYPGIEKDVAESGRIVRKIAALLNAYDVPKMDKQTGTGN